MYNGIYFTCIPANLSFFVSELPGLHLELATRNYLGGPLDYKLLQQDIWDAIHKESLPMNVSKLKPEEIEVYYGVEIIEFIMSDGRALDLWTGEAPDNKRMSQFRDRCSLM